MYHQPASVIAVPDRSQVDSPAPIAITTRATIAMATARTMLTPSATTESRSRSASALAASNLLVSRAGTMLDSRKYRAWTPRPRSTTISATARRGTTNRKRLRITGSRTRATATRSPKA